jgi:hypothetical protein
MLGSNIPVGAFRRSVTISRLLAIANAASGSYPFGTMLLYVNRMLCRTGTGLVGPAGMSGAGDR